MTGEGMFQEVLGGRVVLRPRPGPRHEQICAKLHGVVSRVIADVPNYQLLGIRAQVQLAPDTILCPDLALISKQDGRLCLAAEVIDSQDHKIDTVFKKDFYEQYRIRKLWILDPRYDNLEVYESTEYGLLLRDMLVGRAVLTDPLFPGLNVEVGSLFE